MDRNKQVERFQHAPLSGLFQQELETLYWVEHQLLQSLPLLSINANSTETRDAYTNHLKSIQENIKRLEQIFSLIGLHPKGRISNPAVEILKTCWEIIKQTVRNGAARESGLLIYGQKLVHYKTACYSVLATLAQSIQLNEVPAILKITIQEEKAMGTLLYTIGERHNHLPVNDQPP